MLVLQTALLVLPLPLIVFIFVGSIIGGIANKKFPTLKLLEFCALYLLLECLGLGIACLVTGEMAGGAALLFFAMALFFRVVVRIHVGV